MADIVKKLRSVLPDIKFKESDSFYWSPGTQSVHFKPDTLNTNPGVWALLHETAHAKLLHKAYSSDLELLLLEVSAWEEATGIGQGLGIHINNDHIQDCLDTYRDWLHKRSTCPKCSIVSLQQTPALYSCYNCGTSWKVSPSRFCRPYRLSGEHVIKKTSPGITGPQATFM